jgi:predicted nucleotide-binding protein
MIIKIYWFLHRSIGASIKKKPRREVNSANRLNWDLTASLTVVASFRMVTWICAPVRCSRQYHQYGKRKELNQAQCHPLTKRVIELLESPAKVGQLPRSTRKKLMPKSLRIFLGSSDEAREFAQVIQDLIYEESRHDEYRVTVVSWWSTGVFLFGDTFIESLERIMGDTDAAIIIASEDDRTTVRGAMVTTPRDNITFESGMAIGYHGRRRALLAVIGSPKLPSDLDGVNHLRLDQAPDLASFKERNRGRIRDLVWQWIGTEPPVTDSSEGDEAAAPPTDRSQPLTGSIDDRKLARALVDEIGAYSDTVLSKNNFVRRYEVIRLAVPELQKKMNEGAHRPGSQRSSEQLVTIAEYKSFELRNKWRVLGYNTQNVFEANDGTQAISGVSRKLALQLIQAAGANPYESGRDERGGDDNPIRSISWFDAIAYCLSVGGRLPTTADLAEADLVSGRRSDVWEWTQSWFDETSGHIEVARLDDKPIGVNPDLRLPNIGFRVIMN